MLRRRHGHDRGNECSFSRWQESKVTSILTCATVQHYRYVDMRVEEFKSHFTNILSFACINMSACVVSEASGTVLTPAIHGTGTIPTHLTSAGMINE